MIWFDMIWYDLIWYDSWYDMIWYDSWYDSCAHNEVQSKHFGTCLTMPQPWQCVDPALSPVDGHGDLHRYDWHMEVSYNRGAQSSKFFVIINGKTNGLGYAYFRYFMKAHMNPSLLWGVTKNYKKLGQIIQFKFIMKKNWKSPNPWNPPCCALSPTRSPQVSSGFPVVGYDSVLPARDANSRTCGCHNRSTGQ